VVVRQSGEDKLPVRAATLAYWSAVGFVPLLVLGIALTAPLGFREATLNAARSMLYETVLVSDESQVIGVLEGLLNRVNFQTLGWFGVGGIMMIGSQIYHASELAYNDIFGCQIRRNWFFRLLMFNAVIVTVPVVIGGGLILTSRFGQGLSFNGWWVSFMLTSTALIFAIKFLPNTHVRWRAACIGGVVSAVLFEASKFGFAAYMDLLGTKDNMTRLYGSVAFLPVFLLWLNILWLVVLMGVELAFVVHNRRILVEAQAEQASDPYALQRRPDGLFAVGVLVALTQAEAEASDGAVELVSVANRCGVWSGHVRDALRVMENAEIVRRTDDGRYALVLPPDEIEVEEILHQWAKLGSPRCRTELPVGGLIHQLGGRLRSNISGSLAQLAGLGVSAQEA